MTPARVSVLPSVVAHDVVHDMVHDMVMNDDVVVDHMVVVRMAARRQREKGRNQRHARYGDPAESLNHHVFPPILRLFSAVIQKTRMSVQDQRRDARTRGSIGTARPGFAGDVRAVRGGSQRSMQDKARWNAAFCPSG